MPHKQNYLARMELNRQNRLATGPLSERFPQVSGIMISMTYYQKGVNPVLMLRTIHLLPSDSAYFNMECMIKGCVDGGFDLTPVVTNMVKARKKTGKGRIECLGKTENHTGDHASVEYEIGIRYERSR
ncbi:MAG: hypothetical protein M1497_13400 [Nitrospirae bacterium]|nr:hypothetical protein [Nitrospirota bacterium]